LPGTWNNGTGTYTIHHSQSPCVSCPTGFSEGGLDDRFDFWLGSTNMFDGQGLDLAMPGGHIVYGQDGLHYNNAVNAGGNGVVSQAVADALHDASDHLPVIAIVQRPAKAVAASQLDFGTVIVGATAQQSLTVTNPVPLPADELDYSFAAPAGFSAPAGNFVLAAGAPAALHTIGMSTATSGVRAGTLTLSSDDPDTSARSILLSGRVLDHAVASLDSLVATTVDTLDFGYQAAGSFTDLDVRVHNLGWDALQARLTVESATITGGAGRFSIVGGFSPTLIGGVGRTWAVRFNDAGATVDSTYDATLVFTTADEPLPGAQPQASLVVTLRARVTSGSVGVTPGLPRILRLDPPQPNPIAAATIVAFELPRAAVVDLGVFDLAGRRVATLANGAASAGRNEVRWNATGDAGARLPGGLYFLRLSIEGGASRTRRVAILP
jgi:hypothetical protein